VALNFPSSPFAGQVYEDPTSGNKYLWDGTLWVGINAPSTFNVSVNSAISVKENNSLVGLVTTIDFADNVFVSVGDEIATVYGEESVWESIESGITTTAFVGINTDVVRSNLDVYGQSTLENLQVTGITTLSSLNLSSISADGELTVDNINSTGFSTFADIQVGSVAYINNLEVNGIGTFSEPVSFASSINVDGTSYFNNIEIQGTSTFGEISELNVSGIVSTVNLGVSSIATIQDLNVDGDINVSGSSTISGLTFPTEIGKKGQVLFTDGLGNLGFTTAPGLSVNRIYVSTSGDDQNDGKTLPVRTIKRASQIASFEPGPVAIIVETGEYIEDNPILLYEDVSVIGDNLRNTIIRPLNSRKDMFRVRNGCYVAGFTLKDFVVNDVPQYTFDNAVVFDDAAIFDDENDIHGGYAGETTTVINAVYDHLTGITTITTFSEHNLRKGSTVRLAGLGFTCDYDGGITSLLYPDLNSNGIVDFPIVSVGSTTELTIQAGVTTIPHFYSGGGFLSVGKPLISRSPYIQNCSIISFIGANGVLVDGSRVITPNTPIIQQEVENPVAGIAPDQGKSMIANAFTMLSFGGNGWRVINDGYAQIVSCFQLFCQNGSYSQSGGYLSITNSATNFGKYALRSSGFSPNSFAFDRGVVAATGVADGKQTLQVIGLGRTDQNLYVLRFYNQSFEDKTGTFKPVGLTTVSIDATVGVDTSINAIYSPGHGLFNDDTVTYIQDTSEEAIGELINDAQYYVEIVNTDYFKLYFDDSLITQVGLTSSVGIHTFQKGNLEFFVDSVLNTTHSNYQELTLDSDTYTFVPGRLIQQNVAGSTASGYVLSYNGDKLVVSRESAVQFNAAGSTFLDHFGTPNTVTINSAVGITSYHTLNLVVGSTQFGATIQNISSLIEDYYCHLHRPSIVNSSAHTWEYAGSGTDYNALPQNGGKGNISYEQVSENGGRVYSSGTNELGDFKVGDFINAYNRTGDIIFNNTVTIGELTSLTFKLGSGITITEVSTDTSLGDNEPGGAKDYKLTTQRAQRVFLNNKLGNFIDKTLTTNSVPNAVVQLNSSGQINPDLIPPIRASNYYFTEGEGSRTTLVDNIPAINLRSGDYVVETTGIATLTYQFVNDNISQYLVLSDSTRNYNFSDGQTVLGVNDGSIGIVTTPTSVGYGTTGLVKGVALQLGIVYEGSGYTPGIYTDVSISSNTGIGTSVRANINVSGFGTVTSIDITYGGNSYILSDTLVVDSLPNTGNDYATLQVNEVETRLYTTIANGIKFTGSSSSPNYIQDSDAVGIVTSLTEDYVETFDPINEVDTINNRIIFSGNHSFSNGDPVTYTAGGGTEIDGLSDGETYYAKAVGISSVELYSTYNLSSIVDLLSTGSGTHTLTRVGVNTSTNTIILSSHGYSTGTPVKIEGNDLPEGLISSGFYFVGSVTTNSLTLHDSKGDSLVSINGSTSNPVSLGSTGSGNITFTEQNVSVVEVINTSSSLESTFTINASANIDASNIISGTISPTRLGSGSALSNTFLSGNSTYQKVTQGVGIGSTEPITVSSTAGFDASSGITTYYGNVNISLNRADASTSASDDYGSLGVSRLRKSTFAFGENGSVRIKSSAEGGDVDADQLDGHHGSYYLDPNNLTGSIPVNKGGTGIVATPTIGALLVGNGAAYTLTQNPQIGGTVSAPSANIISGIVTHIRGTNLSYSGIGTIQNLRSSSGIITALSGDSLNYTGLSTVAYLRGQNLNYTGVSTISSLNATYLSGTNLSYSGIGSISTLNVSGLNGTYASGTNLNYSGIGTIANLKSTTGNISNLTGTNLQFTGISTLATLFTTGFGAQNLSCVNFSSSGIATVGNLYVGSSQLLDSSGGISVTSANVSGILTAGGNLYVNQQLVDSNSSSGVDGYVLKTTGAGVSWTSQTSLSVGSANNSLTSNYASTSGVSTNATYATKAGIATYATSAGIATYATSAGIATYATSAGIATNATNVAITNGSSLASVCSIAFVNTLSGNTPILIDAASLNYVPSTDTLHTRNVTVTSELKGKSLVIDNSPTAYTLVAQTNGQIGVGLTPAFGGNLEVLGNSLFYNKVAVGTTIFAAAGNFRGGNSEVGGEYNLVVQASDPATTPSTINSNSSVGSLQICSGGLAAGSARGGQIDFVGGLASAYPGQLLFRTGTATGGTPQTINARLDTSGNLFATQFTSTSDENKKTNIRPIENALDIVNSLNGVRFEWIEDNKSSVGLIAQNVETVLPELVEQDENGTKSVSYGNIVGVLIEAIKEQQKEIEDLKNRIKSLEG
jgi:hypothetical protein